MQQNSINRPLVRLGLSYLELRERPDYWSIHKKMAEFEALRLECEELKKAFILRLTSDASTNTDPVSPTSSQNGQLDS